MSESGIHVIIFHRQMGCIDESATDEEQGEKVLYYYPPTALYEQLSRINMLEGLIDFAAKFSSPEDKLHSVIMDNSLWGFVECEVNVWIAISVPNNPANIPSGPEETTFHKHAPNPSGLCAAIKELHAMFTLFNGNIGDIVANLSTSDSVIHSESLDNTPGWIGIREVATFRKKIRKCKQNLSQVERDIESLEYNEKKRQEMKDLLDEGVTVMEVHDCLHDTVTQPEGESQDIRSLLTREVVHGEPLQDTDLTVSNEAEGAIIIEKSDIEGFSELTNRLSTRFSHQSINVLRESLALRTSCALEESVMVIAPDCSLGFRPDMGTIEELTEKKNEILSEIQSLEMKLSAALSSQDYSPTVIRRKLKLFVNGYIASGELEHPSCFNSWKGTQMKSIGPHGLQHLLKLRETLNSLCNHSNSSSDPINYSILYDGECIWNNVEGDNKVIFDRIMRISNYLRVSDICYIHNSYLWSVKNIDLQSVLSVDGSPRALMSGSGSYEDGMFSPGSPNARTAVTSDDCQLSPAVSTTGSESASLASVPPPAPPVVNRRSSLQTGSMSSPNLGGAPQIQRRNSLQNMKNAMKRLTMNLSGLTDWRKQRDDIVEKVKLLHQRWAADLQSRTGVLGRVGTTGNVYDEAYSVMDHPLRCYDAVCRVRGSDCDEEVMGSGIEISEDAVVGVSIPPNVGASELNQTPRRVDVFAPFLYEASSRIGRLLVVRYKRLIICLILSPTASVQDIVSKLMEQLNGIKFTTELNELCIAIESFIEKGKKSPLLNPVLRYILNNELLCTSKIGNIYKLKADPVSVWPSSIHPDSGIAAVANLNAVVLQEFYQLLSDCRHRFALSSPLLSLSTEDSLIVPLNEAHSLLSDHDLCVTEICVRIKAQVRGGIWVMARRVYERSLYLVLDRCTTVSDAQAVMSTCTGKLLSF